MSRQFTDLSVCFILKVPVKSAVDDDTILANICDRLKSCMRLSNAEGYNKKRVVAIFQFLGYQIAGIFKTDIFGRDRQIETIFGGTEPPWLPFFIPDHADRNAVVFECLGEIVAGKLCPLVRVEDFRRTIAAQSVIKRMDTEIRLTRVLETRQDRILRLYQSMTTTRYINPRAIGI